ncbi:hypothetical protein J6590_090739 [Homalodisca vitripennis]|nr:hypothetical protein J6590_090739 [Homalodisca vitripennis]
MPPSRMESEPSLASLLEAFQNMGKELGTKITCVKSSVREQLVGVNNTIGVMQATMNNTFTENERRKSELVLLKKENHEIRKEMTDQHQQVPDIERNSGKDHVEIVRVPLTRGEDIYYVLERFAKVLNVHLDGRQVSVAHRLPLRSNQEHPNILVKFVQ